MRMMELYLFDQTRDLFEMYMPKIEAICEEEGYHGFGDYTEQLVAKYEENLKPWEKRFLIEVD
jgi:hypothetical protein